MIPVKKKDLEDINNLLSQLSEKAEPLTFDELLEILSQENFNLFTVRDVLQKNQKIIGMGSIVFVKTLSGLKGLIEDIVINENHRGKRLGEQIVKTLIELARIKNAKHIDLTSNPKRKAANRLYKKLGFKRRKTNVYRLEL